MARRCGELMGRPTDYDLILHWVAAGVICLTSIVGVLIPLLGERRSTRTPLSLGVLSCLFACGTGVILATTFIHMLFPSQAIFNHPCLAETHNFEALGLSIIVATILLHQMTEYCLVNVISKLEGPSRLVDMNDIIASPATTTGERATSSPYIGGELDFSLIKDTEFGRKSVEGSLTGANNFGYGNAMDPEAYLAPEGLQNKKKLRVKVAALLIEIGVYVQSFILGLALGTASGKQFTAMFTALAFNQFFEGISLGTTAKKTLKDSSKLAIAVMMLGFGISAPLGVVSGKVMSGSLSSTSSLYLWTSGVLTAVSAGILVYTGIVKLLTYKFTMNPDFARMSALTQALSFFCMFLGAALIAMVGEWF